MYDRQILVDHFNGKRSANDPEVQREFRLLKQKAEIDWREMYAGEDTPVTAESIAEDYINNARRTAKSQRTLKKMKFVAALVVLAVFALVMR